MSSFLVSASSSPFRSDSRRSKSSPAVTTVGNEWYCCPINNGDELLFTVRCGSQDVKVVFGSRQVWGRHDNGIVIKSMRNGLYVLYSDQYDPSCFHSNVPGEYGAFESCEDTIEVLRSSAASREQSNLY